MSKFKNEVKKEEVKPAEMPGFYKGYNIKWLREMPDHSDFHLVAEYDALKAEGGEK